MLLADVAVILLTAYACIGSIFAMAFLTRGLPQIDREAQHATLGFRLIIMPGVAALWPILLSRWLAGKQDPPIESNAHREKAQAL